MTKTSIPTSGRGISRRQLLKATAAPPLCLPQQS